MRNQNCEKKDEISIYCCKCYKNIIIINSKHTSQPLCGCMSTNILTHFAPTSTDELKKIINEDGIHCGYSDPVPGKV